MLCTSFFSLYGWKFVAHEYSLYKKGLSRFRNKTFYCYNFFNIIYLLSKISFSNCFCCSWSLALCPYLTNRNRNCGCLKFTVLIIWFSQTHSVVEDSIYVVSFFFSLNVPFHFSAIFLPLQWLSVSMNMLVAHIDIYSIIVQLYLCNRVLIHKACSSFSSCLSGFRISFRKLAKHWLLWLREFQCAIHLSCKPARSCIYSQLKGRHSWRCAPHMKMTTWKLNAHSDRLSHQFFSA